MLSDVAGLLACPVCGAGLTLGERSLRCTAGHTFDIARQGYVNLLPGDARPDTADTPEMVRTRERFLGAGHFGWLADLLADAVADRTGAAGAVLDAGAGIGYHLAQALDRSPGQVGLALDVSKHALRRAARAHPRIGAAVADLWRTLPVLTSSVDAVLNVFAPRNGAEYSRVLRPGGALFVVTPTQHHLGRLVAELGLLKVDERKTERTERALGGHFSVEHTWNETREAALTHEDVAALVGMGPSARHLAETELRARIDKLPDPVAVPLSVTLSVYLPVQG